MGYHAGKPIASVMYKEEKSLRHVARVAKFLYDNKPKKSPQSLFALFQTYSVSFNLANLGEISLGPYLTLSKLRK